MDNHCDCKKKELPS